MGRRQPRRHITGKLAGLSLLLLAGLIGLRPVETRAQPVDAEQGVLRKQAWRIPTAEPTVWIRAMLYRPPGSGPFPLAVINHGTTGDRQRRAAADMPAFDALANWLVQRGFAVAVPQRLGHGTTGGAYLEELRGCWFPDYLDASSGAAVSIEHALRYIKAQPFIRRDGTLLIGHSAGAMGSFAVASKHAGDVAAVVNFAGGNGGHHNGEPNNNCAPERLVAAAAEFGRTVPQPTLWLYARNDTYFAPDLAERMVAAYQAAGGLAEFHLLPAYGDDGHFLVHAAAAAPLWTPKLKTFLDRLRATRR
jgi:dienelactone hydrolase